MNGERCDRFSLYLIVRVNVVAFLSLLIESMFFSFLDFLGICGLYYAIL